MPQSARTASPTLLFHCYRLLTGLIAPLAYRKVAAKLAAQGVSKSRQRERLGHASLPRPVLADNAPLIWFHGASVGESLAAITLINKLKPLLPEARFLLTSGTATSASMALKRLPQGCQHQFAPLDTSRSVGRFLTHWRPDAGIFVESELWPITLAAAKASGTRLALVNGRLSEHSVKSWRKKLPTARYILGVVRPFADAERTGGAGSFVAWRARRAGFSQRQPQGRGGCPAPGPCSGARDANGALRAPPMGRQLNPCRRRRGRAGGP
ncbi:3-deoxy-D-manno-octulosonic acid transferase [Pseudophaeobacter leonis]|uniref:3-deoxy-D-manno-octulosonic acid transferase n=1 Tax=Pseudophaeobacter leonis TaxID=1144477 RepID=UPI0030C67EE7